MNILKTENLAFLNTLCSILAPKRKWFIRGNYLQKVVLHEKLVVSSNCSKMTYKNNFLRISKNYQFPVLHLAYQVVFQDLQNSFLKKKSSPAPAVRTFEKEKQMQ